MTDRQGELLPCPFCGCDEVVIRQMPHGWDCSEYAAQCKRCLNINGTSLSKQAAVAAWNTRATPDYVKPLVEALRSIAYRPLGGDTETYFCGVDMQNTAKQALSKLPEDLR